MCAEGMLHEFILHTSYFHGSYDVLPRHYDVHQDVAKAQL